MLKFSVLMSVYKNEKPEYLKQAIESIVKQTLMSNEIVIVKDGLLTEELDQVLEEYQENYKELFKIVAFDENRGLGLALRDGVLACQYDYIARMDTDDIAKLDRFEKQIKFLEEHVEIALVGSFSKEFDVDIDRPYASMILPCANIEILEFAKKRNPFRHPTVVFKKSVVVECGNYRDFLWFEDYDLFVRIMHSGYKVANINEFLVFVRADENQFARRGGWKYLEQDLKFQKFLYSSGFINSLQFVNNVFIRSLVRILPNNIRSFIYKKFLRR